VPLPDVRKNGGSRHCYVAPPKLTGGLLLKKKSLEVLFFAEVANFARLGVEVKHDKEEHREEGAYNRVMEEKIRRGRQQKYQAEPLKTQKNKQMPRAGYLTIFTSKSNKC